MNKQIIETPLKAKYLEHFASYEQGLNGAKQSTMHQKRRAALARFEALGFPSIKHEEWKYTNLKQLLSQDYHLDQTSELNVSDLEGILYQQVEANHLVFVNGRLQTELSQVKSPNLKVQTFEAAIAEKSPLLDNYFAEIADSENDSLTALNTAFARYGSVIEVADNQVVDLPVLCYFITNGGEEQIAVQPRNLWLIGKNSQVSFVDTLHNLGKAASFSNMVTEIFVETSAIVKHYKIQNDENAYHIGTTQVKQADKSVYTNITVTLAAVLLRNNLNLLLDGEHIEGNMYGLYMMAGKAHADNHSIADHLKPNSVSNELYKGILEDQASGVFNGKIFVRQDAQKTNAYQQNRNVLLSDTASVNTKPQLEIWADDVKCSHGATTGSLDKNALFYLRSRGIPEQEARALLVHAFANEIIEKIDIVPIREHLESLVLKRLSN